jgi:hypothetical protein
MKLIAPLALAGLIGAAIAKQLPELQRYMKMRQM